MATVWEWMIERWDGCPDNAFSEIVDLDHADTLEEAISMSGCDRSAMLEHGVARNDRGEWVTLGVRRAQDRDGDGNPDYEYHYLHEDPDLPATPQRIQRELRAARAMPP